MKLLFVILAHNHPREIASLSKVLVESGSNSDVAIHFDAGATKSDFADLENILHESQKILLVKQRIECRWGSYSLVQAVTNSLYEALYKNETTDYDYVILLSGACLPNRPLRQLERYLRQNWGKEFIEVAGSEWITDGLRDERHEFWFPFAPSMAPSRIQNNWVRLQRFLGIKRKAPNGLNVRFGSQWWALTGSTCKKIVSYLSDNPAVVSFFKQTYIPDEMVFPTLVNRLVSPSLISNHSLTTFHFSPNGKPVVFHDDHASLVKSFDKFFFRKASFEAKLLRQDCYNIAASEDDGRDLAKTGKGIQPIPMILQSQSQYPRPGQIYYKNSNIEDKISTLQSFNLPYVIFFGSNRDANALLEKINHSVLKPVGNIFRVDEVDFGNLPQIALKGLKPDDVHIRDLHPTGYLTRVRRRITGVPIICWSPGDRKEVCASIADDANALCILSLHNDESFMEIAPTLSHKYLMFGQDNAGFAQRAFQIATQTSTTIPENRLIIINKYGHPTKAECRSKLSSKFSSEDWLPDLLNVLTPLPLEKSKF